MFQQGARKREIMFESQPLSFCSFHSFLSGSTFFHQFSFKWSIIPLVVLYPFLTQVRSYKPVSSRYVRFFISFQVVSSVQRCSGPLAWPRRLMVSCYLGAAKWHFQMLTPDCAPCKLLCSGWEENTLKAKGFMPLWDIFRYSYGNYKDIESLTVSEERNKGLYAPVSKAVDFHWASFCNDNDLDICLEVPVQILVHILTTLQFLFKFLKVTSSLVPLIYLFVIIFGLYLLLMPT